MGSISAPARRWLGLLLVLIVALAAWPSAGRQAAAQDSAVAQDCAAATCIWLPLIETPSPVTFQLAPSFQPYQGRTLISAWVITTGDVPVYHVRYDALLFDAAGRLVYNFPVMPVLEMTEPGRVNPIEASAPVCCDVARVELRLAAWQMHSDRPIVTLPVERLRWTNGSGFAVAIRNNRDVPVHEVRVLVRHTTGVFVKAFPVIAPGETVIYDNPEGNDYWGFFFEASAQGTIAP